MELAGDRYGSGQSSVAPRVVAEHAKVVARLAPLVRAYAIKSG
jgi:hypothetical protein